MKLGDYVTVDELADYNRRQGYHFFSPHTLKSFRSVIYPTVYPVADGWVFVESSRDGITNSRREYRVCLMRVSGGTTHLYDKKWWLTLEAAERNAKKYAQAHPYVKPDNFDTLEFIMRVESEGPGDDYVEGMRHLVNDGTIYRLQGSWQRAAQSLIDQGLI